MESKLGPRSRFAEKNLEQTNQTPHFSSSQPPFYPPNSTFFASRLTGKSAGTFLFCPLTIMEVDSDDDAQIARPAGRARKPLDSDDDDAMKVDSKKDNKGGMVGDASKGQAVEGYELPW